MTQLIIDTDLRSDCDDTAALALAHHLADRGFCEIAGVIASTSGPDVVAAIDAINHFHRRPEIPIGLSPIPDTTGDDDYAPFLAAHFPHRQTNATVPESTLLYRRLLAGAPDGSVTLVVIGAQSPLRLLLDSSADFEGDGSLRQSGEDLIRQKVRETVIMAGNFADPALPEWNVKLDIASARDVAHRWPGSIIYTGFEVGAPILTGYSLSNPEVNPVARAYELYPNTEGGAGVIGGRSSWDLTAVYYAVLGNQFNGETVWELSPPGDVTFTDDARTRFSPNGSAGRRYLISRMPDRQVTEVLENLLTGMQPRGIV